MNNISKGYTLETFYARIYALVGLGVAVSALVSFISITMFTENIVNILSRGTWVILVLWLIEMAFVIFIGPLAVANSPLALPAFIGFSAINGITLTFTLAYFSLTSIVVAFAITSGMFFGLAAFDRVTKRNLSATGKAMFAALIGIIIASLVNVFIQSSVFDFIISIVSVIVFSGLIAWDNQRIKDLYGQLNGDVTDGWAVSMALSLYLDFVNLFISILRLFGYNK